MPRHSDAAGDGPVADHVGMELHVHPDLLLSLGELLLALLRLIHGFLQGRVWSCLPLVGGDDSEIQIFQGVAHVCRLLAVQHTIPELLSDSHPERVLFSKSYHLPVSFSLYCGAEFDGERGAGLLYLRLVYLALLDNRYRNDMTTTDEWVDEISGVKGAYYVQDSLKMWCTGTGAAAG